MQSKAELFVQLIIVFQPSPVCQHYQIMLKIYVCLAFTAANPSHCDVLKCFFYFSNTNIIFLIN